MCGAKTATGGYLLQARSPMAAEIANALLVDGFARSAAKNCTQMRIAMLTIAVVQNRRFQVVIEIISYSSL